MSTMSNAGGSGNGGAVTVGPVVIVYLYYWGSKILSSDDVDPEARWHQYPWKERCRDGWTGGNILSIIFGIEVTSLDDVYYV